MRELIAAGPLPVRKRPRHCGTGGGGSRQSPWRGDRAPGFETREPHGVGGRLRQDPRLRARKACRNSGCPLPVCPRIGRARDASGDGARHGRLHVARAGGGAASWISVPTSSPLARSSMRWPRESAPSVGRPRWTRWPRSSTKSPSRSDASIPRCLVPSGGSWRGASRKTPGRVTRPHSISPEISPASGSTSRS